MLSLGMPRRRLSEDEKCAIPVTETTPAGTAGTMYPVTFPATANTDFLSVAIGRLGYTEVATKLPTVTPNVVNVLVLLSRRTRYSPDRNGERKSLTCFPCVLLD